MRITEFTGWLKGQLEALDHDEIVAVDDILVPPGSSDDPNDKHKRHNMLKIRFANGGSSTVMAQSVRGPGIPRHERYEIPREAF